MTSQRVRVRMSVVAERIDVEAVTERGRRLRRVIALCISQIACTSAAAAARLREQEECIQPLHSTPLHAPLLPPVSHSPLLPLCPHGHHRHHHVADGEGFDGRSLCSSVVDILDKLFWPNKQGSRLMSSRSTSNLVCLTHIIYALYDLKAVAVTAIESTSLAHTHSAAPPAVSGSGNKGKHAQQRAKRKKASSSYNNRGWRRHCVNLFGGPTSQSGVHDLN